MTAAPPPPQPHPHNFRAPAHPTKTFCRIDRRTEKYMALTWRYSALADRHRALGAKLEDWNGMGTAWTYDKDVSIDHAAIRTKAGLMDVSGLKKLYLTGPHSSAILNYATTRDVTKVYP